MAKESDRLTINRGNTIQICTDEVCLNRSFLQETFLLHLKTSIARGLPWLSLLLSCLSCRGYCPHWKLLGVAVRTAGRGSIMRDQRKLNSHPALRVTAVCGRHLCAHVQETRSADWKHLERGGKMSVRPLEQVFLCISPPTKPYFVSV